MQRFFFFIKEKLKTCFRQRERKREGKRRVMVESFPSKEKGTTTKHVKTFRIRLLLSSLAFEIWKDDEYRTCLAWGCSLCNQTTTVSHRLVSESHHKEPSSSWCTDQQHVYNWLSQICQLPGRSPCQGPGEAPTAWLCLPRAEPGHAENMQTVKCPRKTPGICKGPPRSYFPFHRPHFKPSAHTKCKARPQGSLLSLTEQQTAEMRKKNNNNDHLTQENCNRFRKTSQILSANPPG